MTVPRMITSVLVAGLSVSGWACVSSPSPATAATVRARTVGHPTTAFTSWGVPSFGQGRFVHTRTRLGLVIARHPDATSYRDPYGRSRPVPYDRGRWFSPWTAQTFDLTELIASYDATTPRGTFIEVSVRGRVPGGSTAPARTALGRRSSWDSLGRWASYDQGFHRMSLGSQADDYGKVATDTQLTTGGYSYRSWQLRVTLMRRTGSTESPVVTSIGAVFSRRPGGPATTSAAPNSPRRDLMVPRYSQQIHAGEYARWNGGGEAWCSPTSTAMVLAYWHRGPTPKQYAWVRDAYHQPWVDYAARSTFASGYDGTGDWPFNTAYAARFGLDAFVTKLASLRQAALFVEAGIPLVASISFGPGDLDGAPVGSTAGHLVVIRGFTGTGDVIVNDPAAGSAKGVRRVYRRGQFEDAWVGATGGVVYVIRPASRSLPARGVGRAW